MSYPPTNPGYPQTQPPGPYGAPGPSFAPAEAGPSKLPLYLTVAVVVLGLAAYLASFGPVFTVSAELGPFGGAELTGSGGGYPIIAATLAALLAAASLLPKVKGYSAVVAAVSVLAVLLVIAQLVSKPPGFSIGWALWLVLAFTLLEALAAAGCAVVRVGSHHAARAAASLRPVRSVRAPAWRLLRPGAGSAAELPLAAVRRLLVGTVHRWLRLGWTAERTAHAAHRVPQLQSAPLGRIWSAAAGAGAARSAFAGAVIAAAVGPDPVLSLSSRISNSRRDE